MGYTKNKVIFLGTTASIILMSILAAIFPLQTLVLFLSGILLVYTILRPYKVFVLLIAYIPFEYIVTSLIPLKYQDVFGLIPESLLMLILMCIFLKRNRRKIKFTSIDFFLISVILLGILISIHNKISMFYVINGIRVLFRYISIFYICRMIKDPVNFFRKESDTFKNILIIEVAIGIIQICLKKIGVLNIDYISGSIVRYDQYATFLAILSIFLFSRYFVSKKKKGMDLVLILLSCVLILISTSRQGFLFLIIGIMTIILSNFKTINIKNKFKYIIIFGYLVTLLICVYYFVTNSNISTNTYGSSRNALKSFFSLFQSETYTVDINKNFRLYFIFGVGSFLIKNYFWGIGWGTFGASYSTDYDLVNYIYRILEIDDSYHLNFIADVNWITLVGQIGILGTVLFSMVLLLISLKSLKNIKKLDNPYCKMILSSSVAILVSMICAGFLGPHFEIKTSSFYMWFIAGLSINCIYNYKYLNS